MKKLATILLWILLLNACATMNLGSNGFNYRENQEKKLAVAIKLQNAGKVSSAVELFKSICAEKGLTGVTDEALFRLSLLYIGYGLDNDREYFQTAQQNIDRMRKEYPASPWTRMVEPVADLLTNSAELRRQNANIRSQNQSLSKENQSLSKENQSLSKENQELRENIEKLKRLDLELDKNRK